MQNNKPISYIQQGEIHIRELNNLLINSKKIIIIFTLFFSLIATIYAYSLKPSYEASSVIEIGFYNKAEILDNQDSRNAPSKIFSIENSEEVANNLRMRLQPKWQLSLLTPPSRTTTGWG